MRIAFFTDTFLPNIDGVVCSLLAFRKELRARGHEVFVFASGSKKARALNRDPRVFYFRSLAFPPYPQYKLALNPFRAKKIARARGVELVHCHGVASMGVAAVKTARDLRLPLVGSFHTMIPLATMYVSRKRFIQRVAEKIAWRALRAFYKPFDAVTTPSHAAKRVLEEHGVEKVFVVPNPIDLKRFNPAVSGEGIRKKFLRDGEKLVLSASRIGFEKQIDLIIRAAEIVLREEPARFIVTGDGPARKQCEELARGLGLAENFVFTGFVPSAVLPRLYAASDCFVTASRFETQGIALLEAMACGVPCVGARALAVPEAVRDGFNGFLFKPGDEEDCARKILRVLQAPPREARRLSKNARATAFKYSADECVGELLEVYEKVL